MKFTRFQVLVLGLLAMGVAGVWSGNLDAYEPPTKHVTYGAASLGSLNAFTFNQPTLNTDATWNNPAALFTHHDNNVTDTASLGSSVLFRYRVGGTDEFKVYKNGQIFANGVNYPDNAPIAGYTIQALDATHAQWAAGSGGGGGGGGSPTGSAGGDLGGTYPNPAVDAFHSATTSINVASATAPTAGQNLTATDSTHATWQTPPSTITPWTDTRYPVVPLLQQTLGIPSRWNSSTVTIGSSGLAIPAYCCFDGTNVWTANSAGNTVSVINAATHTVTHTITVGNAPRGVCFDGANIWASNSTDGTVSQINATTFTVVNTVTVGAAPAGLCTDGTNVWVANGVGTTTVSEILISTHAVINTVTVGNGPVDACFDGIYVWVTNTTAGTVSQITASTHTVANTVTVGTTPVGVCFDGTNVWVANTGSNSVSEILASTHTVINTVTSVTTPVGICFDGVSIWVGNNTNNHVTQILASTHTVTTTFATTDAAYWLCFDGTYVWVVDWANGGSVGLAQVFLGTQTTTGGGGSTVTTLAPLTGTSATQTGTGVAVGPGSAADQSEFVAGAPANITSSLYWGDGKAGINSYTFSGTGQTPAATVGTSGEFQVFGLGINIASITSGTVSPTHSTEWSNAGALADAEIDLPRAANGCTIGAFVDANHYIKVKVPAPQVLYLGATPCPAGTYFRSTTIGSSLHVVQVDQFTWIAREIRGTWLVSPN